MILIVLLSILLCGVVSAHSGRTDANGGHTDRSTGTYHYHHGYPAHQHAGGVCPYFFDDKTGENSGNSSNNGGSVQTTNPGKYERPLEAPNVNHSEQKPPEEKKTVSDGKYLPLWFAVFFLPCFAVYKAKKRARDAKNLYSGKSISALACVPAPYSMDFDERIYRGNKLVEVSSLKVVYVTRSGSSYHRSQCSSLRATKIEISLKDAKSRGYKKCRTCCPEGQIPSWVLKYNEINRARKKYKIDMRP